MTMLAQDGPKNFIDQNYIEINGTSEVEIVPDLIYLHILISEKDNKNKTPLAERERDMILKLKEIGINTDKDLLMKEIISNFQYAFMSRNEILLSKSYQLLVRDGKTASRVFVELERLGISNAGIDRLDNTQIEKYRRDVKVAAVTAAKSKAESLVSAVGQSIGKALFIQEIISDNGIPRFQSNTYNAYSQAKYADGKERYSEADMDFEKIKLTSSILCRFELK